MTNIQPLEEMTLKQLQDEASKLGLEQIDLFKTKGPLIAAINSLLKVQAQPTINTTPQVIVPEPVNPKEERVDEKKWQSKADRMRDHLESQPKVRVMIPLEHNEKQGVVRKTMVRGHEETIAVSGGIWVTNLNGLHIVVPKGIYYDVPEQVADKIGREYNQTQHAGDQFRIDRIDPKTGRPVSEQL
jgi:hypothetical protein